MENIVVYGGRGSGKSTYARELVNPLETVVLGVGRGKVGDMLALQMGGIERHIADDKERGIESRRADLKTAKGYIERLEKPNLVIDEWAGFFFSSWWKPESEIKERIEEMYQTMEDNSHLEKAILIITDAIDYLPFRLYKKMGLWNKEAFRRADQVIKVEFGIPVQIKPSPYI